MPLAHQPGPLDDARSFWTGLDPQDLRALLRAPLDPERGFAIAPRVPGSADSPAVPPVLAIAAVLGDEGVPVTAAGTFGAASVQAITVLLSGAEEAVRSEDDAPHVRFGRELAEAAGLIERQGGRVRLTEAGGRLTRGDPDTLLPHLFRVWARGPIGRWSRLADVLHATWPLTVLLLQRFGERWLPATFYAAVIAEIAPEALQGASSWGARGAGASSEAEDARSVFERAYLFDVVVGFAAFFGLVELSWAEAGSETADEADGAEPVVRATRLLFDLLVPAVEPAPATEASGWAEPYGSGADATHGALQAAIAERTFDSEEELRTFVAAFMDEHNAAPADDFDGLSPASMQALLTDPFGDGSPLVVADVPRVPPRSVLLHLVLDLVEGLGEGGMKATDAGNLPRAYVCAAVERYELAGWRLPSFVNVRNEQDFGDLHFARFIARMTGLVTLRRGRWHVTKACRSLVARSGAAGVYAALFRTVTTKYAWNSADSYPELDIMQASWAFSLLQLLRHGGTWRDGAFYVERFTRAFPAARDEVAYDTFGRGWTRGPEEVLARAYELRVLERFAALLGLADVEVGSSLHDYGRVLRVRATPALGELVAERPTARSGGRGTPAGDATGRA
jgi:hypothetical protein